MTPEAQRIAISEACGWTRVNWTVPRPEPWWTSGSPDDYAVTADDLPDYLNDLNAMHEAENMLLRWDDERRDHGDRSYWGQYSDALCRIGVGGLARSIHATAAQRAEAFLKTLNLWRVTP